MALLCCVSCPPLPPRQTIQTKSRSGQASSVELVLIVLRHLLQVPCHYSATFFTGGSSVRIIHRIRAPNRLSSLPVLCRCSACAETQFSQFGIYADGRESRLNQMHREAHVHNLPPNPSYNRDTDREGDPDETK